MFFGLAILAFFDFLSGGGDLEVDGCFLSLWVFKFLSYLNDLVDTFRKLSLSQIRADPNPPV